ncbi:MAG: ATP-binding protein, partial [Acetatifactor sp.]|nr:ATP-binding protein [Acetatifactor sp.]
IIDEWDAPIREMPESQKEYLGFLRSLFKSSGTTDKIFAAVYITGILPIKKDGTESAISDFWEYSMLEPGEFQAYVGFTEEDVKKLCQVYGLSFEEAKRWYDGYAFDDVASVYNPYSIMKAIIMKKFKSYWRMSAAADVLEDYIAGDYDGLFQAVLELLGGCRISVDTDGFNNDITTVRNRDDLLTLLIHLGYLAYDGKEGTVRIPNEEIKIEFSKSIREVKNTEALMRMRESHQLILDTVQMNEAAVAAQIEKIHAEMTDPLHYNSEQALRSVIQIAYYSYPDYYLKFEELPSGDGYADIVYFPKRSSPMPILVVELKWNKSAEGAIEQIRNKRYFDVLKEYGSEILLVGICYDKDRKSDKRRHACRIERL